MNNYGELKLAWEEWSHRTDLTESVIGNIQKMTAARLGRDLRTDTNIKTEEITIPVDGYTMPFTWKEIHTIRNDAGHHYQFVSSGHFSSKAAHFEYTIEGRKLYVDKGATVIVTYWHEPDQLIDDNDSNDVLQAWPNLYLYSGLIEIFRFIQDSQAMVLYTQQYTAELAKTNEQSQRKRIGNAPVMGY